MKYKMLCLNSWNLAWDKYDGNYKAYITTNLGKREFDQVMGRYVEVNTEYDKGVYAIQGNRD